MAVNGQNTSSESQVAGEQVDTGSENPIVAAVQSVQSKAKIALLALGLTTASVTGATAEENVQIASAAEYIQVAVTSPVEAETLPSEDQWVLQLNLSNPEIAEIIGITPLEYNMAELREFAALSTEDQEFFVAMYHGIGGDTEEAAALLESDLFKLVQRFRVSPLLRQAILDEAQENGASSRIQRGINNFLSQLARSGDLTESRLNVIIQNAPESVKSLPIMIALSLAEGRLIELQEIREKGDEILGKS